MDFEVLLSFIITSTILILIPGPVVITIVSDSISHGTRKSLLSISGAAIAHTSFIIITALGMSKILMHSLELFLLIKWIGVSYLILTGFAKLIKSKNQEIERKIQKRKSALFLKGFLVTISNPKAIIFYAAFFPPFLNPAKAIPQQYLVLGTTFIVLFLILSYLTVRFASLLSEKLTQQKQVLTDRISGIMMVIAGVVLASIKTSK